ncbi:class I SAM-dependent methyltransferase [Dictyobacter arantiisoli]|uniref:Methyltransferase domain-containing protein n=1 Tax=Dictyobacter arantiisoli TaxID=2014874 RepID=A0A5A5TBG2_9CHLR|nr:class I SAM-dependent methyltransferase [Dictyobacter arantiisoli]GCF08821.1 hypothetical protein KDI_23850 [Dictyobacter arantiisoli]
MHLFKRLQAKIAHDNQTIPYANNPVNRESDMVTDDPFPSVIDAPYLLAHDLPEHNRLEFQHFFLKGVLHTNYQAPLDKTSLQAILDVGSGTGRWVIEMAQSFPQATVTGLDLVETAITDPPNILFVQHNALDGLPFANDCFDYLHSRLLVAGIPAAAWSSLLLEYVRVTRPGGWIELLEGGTTFVNIGPCTQQYLTWWDQISRQRGIDASLISQLPEIMQRIGVKNLRKRLLHVPIGEWGGRAGSLLLTNITAGWKNLRGTFIEQLGIAPSQFDYTFNGLTEEWERLHTQYEYISIFGQIPDPRTR